MILSIVQSWLASFAVQQPTACKAEWEGKVKAVVEPGKIWWVWHNATAWSARSHTSADFRPGDWVKVIDRQGSTLIIEPWEPSQQ